MHETVKKSIEASSRTQTPTTSSDTAYDYPSSTTVGNPHTSTGGYTVDPGHLENTRVTYPPSSLAEDWKYAERAQLAPPSSSSSSSSPSLHPAENTATSTYHSLHASGKPLPISSVSGYYPPSSAGYVTSAGDLTGSGPSLPSREGAGGVRMGYDYEVLQDRLSNMAVTSASEYPTTHAHPSPTPVSYPVSTGGLESTYNPTMADSRSVPMASPVPRPGSYSSSPVPDSYISPEFSRGAEEQQLPDYPYSSAMTSVETSKTITTVSNVSSQSSRSTEDELRDRIKQLEQELKQKEAAIEQKDAAIEQQKRQQTSSYTSPSKVYQSTTSPIHSGPISVRSSHHSGPIQHSSFSGPIQVHVGVTAVVTHPPSFVRYSHQKKVLILKFNPFAQATNPPPPPPLTHTHTHTHTQPTNTPAALFSPQHNAAVSRQWHLLCPAHPHTPRVPPPVERTPQRIPQWASQWAICLGALPCRQSAAHHTP